MQIIDITSYIEFTILVILPNINHSFEAFPGTIFFILKSNS